MLYELLTGKQAFAAGETVSDAIAAILKNEPDWNALPAEIPQHLRTLLRRCLQKDPQKRLPHIGVARLEIEEGTEVGASGGATGIAPPPSVQRRERLAWAAALAVVALIAAGALAWALRPVPLPPEMRAEINTPPTTDPFSFAISPDGRQVVFVASGDGPPRLWLRSLDAVAAQALPGTEGAQLPFWSPDSQSVAFFADGALKRLDIGGGAPRTLAKAPAGRGGTWSEGGIILFSPTVGRGIFRTSATGGAAVAVTTVAGGQLVHFYPQFLPGGRQFLFYGAGNESTTGIYLGSLDGPEIIRVTPADAAGLYASPGWLLFPRAGTLVAWRFDRARGELTGEPVTVADAIGGMRSTFGRFRVRAGSGRCRQEEASHHGGDPTGRSCTTSPQTQR